MLNVELNDYGVKALAFQIAKLFTPVVFVFFTKTPGVGGKREELN